MTFLTLFEKKDNLPIKYDVYVKMSHLNKNKMIIAYNKYFSECSNKAIIMKLTLSPCSPVAPVSPRIPCGPVDPLPPSGPGGPCAPGGP